MGEAGVEEEEEFGGGASRGASHERAAVPLQRPLQADGGVVLPHATGHGAAQQLFEQQHHVPVELGRALHVAALPRLLHQHGDGAARGEALPLEVPLAAHH